MSWQLWNWWSGLGPHPSGGLVVFQTSIRQRAGADPRRGHPQRRHHQLGGRGDDLQHDLATPGSPPALACPSDRRRGHRMLLVH